MSDLSPAPDGLNGTDHEASKKPCSYSGKTLDEVLRIAEGNVTLGDHAQSPVCAQVLGFKFAGCQVIVQIPLIIQHNLYSVYGAERRGS